VAPYTLESEIRPAPARQKARLTIFSTLLKFSQFYPPKVRPLEYILLEDFMKRDLQKSPIVKSFSRLSYRYGYFKPIQNQDVLVSCVAVIEL
jgi:hypothetical protein